MPGALIALVAATAAVAVFGLEEHGITVLGDVPAGLPRFALVDVDHDQFYALLPLAIVVSLVVMVQTAATTRSFPSAGDPQDIDRDFVGAGCGSVLAGLLGAFPVNSSPPRTAIVVEVGGRSQAAGLWRSRSSWRSRASAPACWRMCPRPRSAACCCSWRSASFGCRPSWKFIGARPANSRSSWPP